MGQRARTQSHVALLYVPRPGCFWSLCLSVHASLSDAGVIFLGFATSLGKSMFHSMDGGPEIGGSRKMRYRPQSSGGYLLSGKADCHTLLGIRHGWDGSVLVRAGADLRGVIAYLVMYRLYRHDDLTSRVRLVLTVVAASCMVVNVFFKNRDGSEGQGDAVGKGGGGAPRRGGETVV